MCLWQYVACTQRKLARAVAVRNLHARLSHAFHRPANRQKARALQVYEKTMRVPLGRDVNTEASFRELTRPEVIKQTGQIIQPLKLNKPALAAAAKKRSRRENVVVVAGGQVKRNKKH
jgi:Utp14 protein